MVPRIGRTPYQFLSAHVVTQQAGAVSPQTITMGLSAGQLASDNDAHDLVRAFEDLVHA
jgi:hypothetical protein